MNGGNGTLCCMLFSRVVAEQAEEVTGRGVDLRISLSGGWAFATSEREVNLRLVCDINQ